MVSFKNQVDKTIMSLRKDIDKVAYKVVNAVADDVEKNAQINFDRAIPDVPADYPEVVVSSSGTTYTGKTSIGRTIYCRGNQVLFIEFGAGVQNKMTQQSVIAHSRVANLGTKDQKVVWVRGRDKDIPARGFSFSGNALHEEDPRPQGIVGLGEYGRHLGKNDFWIYLSASGRVANGDERWGMNRRGEFKIKTTGIAPVRALWRARNGALNKLFSGRLRLR